MVLNTSKLPNEGDTIKANRRFEDETKEEKQVTYIIRARIGQGGFGAVYKAECLDDGSMMAIKCEPDDCKQKMLQMEFSVMRAGRSSGSPYFTEYGERGRSPGNYFFFTMQLVDRNLWDLLKETKGNGFSLNTSCRVAIQTLAGVRDLHEIGRLHRDIKPANFAVGRKDNDRDSIIYMLDFGMCRMFRWPNGKLRGRRQSTRFRGTHRYASVGSMDHKEQSRKDDIEGWFYMVLEFTSGNVPWNALRAKEDRHEVLKKKREFRDPMEFDSYLLDCPVKSELKRILDYIDTLDFYSIPDYNGMHKIILKTIERNDFRESEPLDWSPRRIYQPPDWSRDGYIKIRDRYGKDSSDGHRRHEPSVTDSSSKIEKGGHSINETVTAATGATATALGADYDKKEKEKEKENEQRDEEKGKRRKKEKDKERRKPTKKSESDKNNSAHAEKVTELKVSFKRAQQPVLKQTAKGNKAGQSIATPLNRQKESRKGEKDITGGAPKITSGKKPK